MKEDEDEEEACKVFLFFFLAFLDEGGRTDQLGEEKKSLFAQQSLLELIDPPHDKDAPKRVG
jgi:hypothetical protein